MFRVGQAHYSGFWYPKAFLMDSMTTKGSLAFLLATAPNNEAFVIGMSFVEICNATLARRRDIEQVACWERRHQSSIHPSSQQ